MRWLALGLLLLAACQSSIVDPMQRQPKDLPYGTNPFYDDGRAMRPPPANTIPRERRLSPPELVSGTSEGRYVERMPVPLTPKLLQEGREQFDIHCAACHGRLGDGNSVVSRKMPLRPPPSLHDFRDRPDGFFYAVISQGFGFMPSYADRLTIEQRWAVVAYVRALQLSQHVPLDQAPPDVRQRLGQGAGP